MPKVRSKRLCPQDFMIDRPLSVFGGQLTRQYAIRPAKMMYRGMGYNWSYRNTWKIDLVVKNFVEIHYLTEHAPEKVKRRWKQAKIRWEKRMAWWKSRINSRL